MSNDMLEKVISTSTIGAGPASQGGYLNDQQSGTFSEYLWDATTLGNQVRKVQMRTDTVELNRLAIGERLLRVATEAVDDGVNPAVAFNKVSLSSEKFRLDWELSTEALEDGLTGDSLDDTIARLMAQQVSNDLEDLAINGDPIGKKNDALLKGLSGWRRRLYDGGHVVEGSTIAGPPNTGITTGTLHKGTFAAALRAMPREYMSARGSLKWFTVSGLLTDYVYQNSAYVEFQGGYRNDTSVDGNNLAPGAEAGWSPAAPFGIAAREVPLFPEYTNGGHRASDLWLVDPQNLIWGIRRQVQVYREFKPKKDTVEYTLYVRCGTAVENPRAAVIVKNVRATA